jgi:[ribosomal protein S5]-alanine N-acetyltransferase
VSHTHETPRLVLREPEPADAERMRRYHRINEERLARWEPAFVDDLAHWTEWVHWRTGESGSGRGRSFLAFDRADPAQMVAVVNLYGSMPSVTHAMMLGYSVDGAYEGKGYAREAIAAVIAHAFEVLNVHRIVANYEPVNERSGLLLRRLGFVVEGYARDMLFLRGTWRDQVLTSIINPSWNPNGVRD